LKTAGGLLGRVALSVIVYLGGEEMNRFLKVFGEGKPADWNQRVFLPVIHVKHGDEFETSYRGVRTAIEAGADGAFLIEMSCRTSQGLMTKVAHDIQESLCQDEGDFQLGVNYLNMTHEPDLQVYEAMRLSKIPLIWSDNPGGRRYVEGARARVGWDGVYFGAVAFKYQAPVSLEELPGVAQEASWMDVLTSSGESTGQAIDLEKARVFAESVPDSFRAVASGVTVDNVALVLPYFHAILAATSISEIGSDELSLDRTREVTELVHNWRP
jgi:hypothetical protein